MNELPEGLYELLHSRRLHNCLEENGLLERASWEDADKQRIYHLLALPIAREITAALMQQFGRGKRQDEVFEILRDPDELANLVQDLLPLHDRVLTQITPAPPIPALSVRPDTPLSESALLTGSSRTPSLQSQIRKELATCDRAEWLVSFIKFAGIRQLLPMLRSFTQKPAEDGKPRLRIATTSYMGATDVQAVRLLMELPNTEVRISYDTHRTRLHAKAYLFHRATGFSSAYIGSANVSKTALNEGLEWTAKVSQFESMHLWQHAVATFTTHWEDSREFVPCTAEDLPELARAIEAARGSGPDSREDIPFFDLRPFGFQQEILQQIAAERSSGKQTHLIIAATGTGKTMVAAFDYRNYCREHSCRPRLLFIAHREEILRQALRSFQQVLHDHEFGELLVGGSEPVTYDHLFCTVASWNSRRLDRLPSDHFEYVVLDEAHHSRAASYRKLIEHTTPRSLIGLTATPERSDGRDIRDDFDGIYSHELRLPEAVERALLTPFHYYGIPDHHDIDFSAVSWNRGRYDIGELRALLEKHDGRARWIFNETAGHVADIGRIRGLGFCVSIQHAEYMAEAFSSRGVPAKVLTGNSSKQERRSVQRELERRQINIIFTVDLYNEGVDIPVVDTVLFLRPTESLTLFLQQLGRGLRLHEEKEQLTVLDFIAPQHDHFDFSSRFRALSRIPNRRIDKQIEEGMPFVPAGCFIQLEKQAQEYVIDHIRRSSRKLQGKQFSSQLRRFQYESGSRPLLRQLMDFFLVDSPDPIYRQGIPSQLTGTAGNETISASFKLNEGLRRLLLSDDTSLIEQLAAVLTEARRPEREVLELLHAVLWSGHTPGDGTLRDAQEFLEHHPGFRGDLVELLNWIQAKKSPIPPVRFEQSGPLVLHASYTRRQIYLALGRGSFEKPFFTQSGVLHIPERNVDVFLADINKNEDEYTPSTMYRDYAVTDRLFHWQSMSTTSVSSPTGERYINHLREQTTPLLFIREKRRSEAGVTMPYVYAGPLRYRSHEGSRPISFIWELEHPLPERVLSWARLAG